MARDLFIGIMSGTSTDGVDAVLADFSTPQPSVAGAVEEPFDPTLRRELLDLNASGPDELDRGAAAGIELARCYARAVRALLAATGVAPADVRAIGCHGQTVRHRPQRGYSIQLGNPAWLVELTGIGVVADFRSRDIAAGGQGAPLVPAFHAAVFGDPTRHRVIANIGGIANLTDLPPDGAVAGFDCGPGNILLDAWTERHLGARYDRDGAFALSGRSQGDLLRRLCAHRFFALPPPKSTGRDDFNLPWLDGVIGASQYLPEDVQATLVDFSATTLATALRGQCAGAQDVYLCGGGARNPVLVAALKRELAGIALASTDALGVDARHVEAFAFAWLARQALLSLPGNLPAVTGAHASAILGAIYPR